MRGGRNRKRKSMGGRNEEGEEGGKRYSQGGTLKDGGSEVR